MRRLSALVRARVGYALGCLIVAVGVTLNWGIGWGLIVAGAFIAASFLVLADVDAKRTSGGERS